MAGHNMKESLSISSSSLLEAQSVSLSSCTTPTTHRAGKQAVTDSAQNKLDIEQQENTADLQGTLLRTITQLMHQPQQQVRKRRPMSTLLT